MQDSDAYGWTKRSYRCCFIVCTIGWAVLASSMWRGRWACETLQTQNKHGLIGWSYIIIWFNRKKLGWPTSSWSKCRLDKAVSKDTLCIHSWKKEMVSYNQHFRGCNNLWWLYDGCAIMSCRQQTRNPWHVCLWQCQNPSDDRMIEWKKGLVREIVETNQNGDQGKQTLMFEKMAGAMKWSSLSTRGVVTSSDGQGNKRSMEALNQKITFGDNLILKGVRELIHQYLGRLLIDRGYLRYPKDRA